MPRIRVLKEKVIMFSEAHLHLPGEPTYSTLYCWWTRGRKSRTGKNVKLEAIKLTRGMATTLEAYGRFIRFLNDEG